MGWCRVRQRRRRRSPYYATKYSVYKYNSSSKFFRCLKNIILKLIWKKQIINSLVVVNLTSTCSCTCRILPYPNPCLIVVCLKTGRCRRLEGQIKYIIYYTICTHKIAKKSLLTVTEENCSHYNIMNIYETNSTRLAVTGKDNAFFAYASSSTPQGCIFTCHAARFTARLSKS